MRKLTLASLSLVLGCSSLAFACNGSGDADDTDGTEDSSSGGSTSSGGAGSGGGTSTGGGDGLPEGCLAVVKATGTPSMITDFNGLEDPTMLLENDGRAGQLTHGTFLQKEGGAFLEFPPEMEGGGEGGGPSYLHFRCVAGAAEEDKACNTDWDEANPWVQYAGVETLLQLWSADGKNCYDADPAYTGLSFKAKSVTGENKLRIQFATPKANSDTGETYQSAPITLTSEWATYTVAFADIAMPSWSLILPKQLDPKTLTSLSFVVRNAEEQGVVGGVAKGEKLLPYDIALDDIEFITE